MATQGTHGTDELNRQIGSTSMPSFDPNTESLKANIARMEAELAAMKETLSKRERNWPDELERGMLFRYKDGDVFMTVQTAPGRSLILASLSAGDAGNSWAYGACFNGRESEFTYLGLAADHLRVV